MSIDVLTTADAVDGVWTYALDLARWLSQRQLNVTIATMGPRPSAAQLAEAEAAEVSVVSHDAKLEWIDAPWQNVQRAGAWLLDLEARLSPDIVHVNGYSHAASAFDRRPWSRRIRAFNRGGWPSLARTRTRRRETPAIAARSSRGFAAPTQSSLRLEPCSKRCVPAPASARTRSRA